LHALADSQNALCTAIMISTSWAWQAKLLFLFMFHCACSDAEQKSQAHTVMINCLTAKLHARVCMYIKALAMISKATENPDNLI